MLGEELTAQMRADLERFVQEHKAALDALAKEDPTPLGEELDFDLGAACQLGDTECESCQ